MNDPFRDYALTGLAISLGLAAVSIGIMFFAFTIACIIDLFKKNKKEVK